MSRLCACKWALLRGNAPPFLRRNFSFDVTVTDRGHTLGFSALPDYLSIGAADAEADDGSADADDAAAEVVGLAAFDEPHPVRTSGAATPRVIARANEARSRNMALLVVGW